MRIEGGCEGVAHGLSRAQGKSVEDGDGATVLERCGGDGAEELSRAATATAGKGAAAAIGVVVN